MRPNRAARVAAVLLIAAGLAALVAAGLVAQRDFSVQVGPAARRFQCGSVLFAKDPRNRAGRFEQVPRILNLANNRCEKTRSDRTHTATTFMVVGAIPLLIVLALPAFSRRARIRARRRART